MVASRERKCVQDENVTLKTASKPYRCTVTWQRAEGEQTRLIFLWKVSKTKGWNFRPGVAGQRGHTKWVKITVVQEW